MKKLFVSSRDIASHKNLFVDVGFTITIIMVIASIIGLSVRFFGIPNFLEPKSFSNSFFMIITYGFLLMIFNQIIYRLQDFVLRRFFDPEKINLPN